MAHATEEQLVLLYYSESADAPSVERHLAECAHCRAEYQNLQLVLNTVDSAPAPERQADYGALVWRRLAPQIGRRRGWSALFQPKWWVLVPTTAMLLAAAFFAGRLSHPAGKPALASASQVRERILLVAVGDHLDRSQMVLAELSNSPDGKGQIDISEERQQAEQLLDDNRLYRQTARSTGDTAVATVLDDLERVLLEIANSPAQVSNHQLDQLRQEISDRGLMFKVRVIGSDVRQRESTPMRAGKSNSEGTQL
ncbi:MAG: anti-sigma factor family protein [Bryobacteraceae bacterium]